MTSNNQHYAYFQGRIVPEENANISIRTHALQYGTSVIGGIRGYYNSKSENIFLFRIEDHYHRLLNSAKIMQLKTVHTLDELKKITIELIQKSKLKENIYLRPFIYTSSLQLSPRLHDVDTELAIYLLKLNEYLDTQNGLSTMISSWRRIDVNNVPSLAKSSGGYINSALAKSEAVQNGYDEAIFLDSRGFVSEGSAENLFIVRKGVLITPPLSASILEGITRGSIIQIARDLGFLVEEREINRSELYIADEVFFTGTGVQVAWIKSVDKRIIGKGVKGDVTSKIQNYFFEIVRGDIAQYDDWLTPVY